jgi:hypothetical protein
MLRLSLEIQSTGGQWIPQSPTAFTLRSSIDDEERLYVGGMEVRRPWRLVSVPRHRVVASGGTHLGRPA